jgi:hypothetical protein
MGCVPGRDKDRQALRQVTFPDRPRRLGAAVAAILGPQWPARPALRGEPPAQPENEAFDSESLAAAAASDSESGWQ